MINVIDRLANIHLNTHVILLGFAILCGSIFLASAVNPTGGTWVNYGGILKEGYYPAVGYYPYKGIFPYGQPECDAIYVVGTDDYLWLNYKSKWYNLGGNAVTSSPVVVRDCANWDHVFVRGSDGALWDRSVNLDAITATVVPGTWTSLGGYIKAGTNPSAAHRSASEIIISVHGGDDGLWRLSISTVNGLLWYSEMDEPNGAQWFGRGGNIIGSPSLFATDIVTAVRGSDNSLWTDDRNLVWSSFGGDLAGDPTISFLREHQPYMLVLVKNSDGALWANQLDIFTKVNTWKRLGGQISGADSPTRFDYDYDDSEFHVFVTGTDNALWVCDSSGNWDKLGGQITSKPVAPPYSPDGVSVFARGADGALWMYKKTVYGLPRPSTIIGTIKGRLLRLRSYLD